MKMMFLAAAAVLTLGAGSAFAAGNTTAQPVQPQQRTTQAQAPNDAADSAGVYGSGIYVSSAPRHEVWVYGAMQSPGYSEGGEQ